MAAPSPALIVSDPPPLNSTRFPLRVDEFPALQIADFDGVIHRVARATDPVPEENPARFE